jgi:hypothetical protein
MRHYIPRHWRRIQHVGSSHPVFRGVLVEKRTGQSTPQELREIPRSTEFIDFLFEFFYQIAVPSALLFLVLRIVWPRVVKLVDLTDLDKILALVAGEQVERHNPMTDGHYRYRN